MMHKARSSIEEVPYCFSRSSVKFQGHIALKIVEFDSNWAFPDCNSSLNSPMAMKCCTKLETAKKRCPIAFQVHPSNFKVTRDKTSPNLTQIGRFQTIGRSQLSNPSDLPCFFRNMHNVHLNNKHVSRHLWFFYDFFFSVPCSSSTTTKKIKLLFSITKTLLTHTLAFFWRNQSCSLLFWCAMYVVGAGWFDTARLVKSVTYFGLIG